MKHCYQMREKLISIGDDFWIENGIGQRIFKVDGKAIRIRETLKIQDIHGKEVAEIQDRLLTIRETLDIARDGNVVATVKKNLVTPLHGHFTVNVAGAAGMEVEGNIVAHEYRIVRGGRHIAKVSRKWFHFPDSYGVDIQPGQDDVLILAIAVIVDQMTYDIVKQ